jgi:hypothetical protein
LSNVKGTVVNNGVYDAPVPNFQSGEIAMADESPEESSANGCASFRQLSSHFLISRCIVYVANLDVRTSNPRLRILFQSVFEPQELPISDIHLGPRAEKGNRNDHFDQ